jgi:hypothetical protein
MQMSNAQCRMPHVRTAGVSPAPTQRRTLTLMLVAALFLPLPARAGGIVVDKENNRVIVDAKIAARKMPYLTDIYPIEVIACWGPDLKGEKAHEAVVNIEVKPSEVHKALEALGLKAGRPAVGESAEAQGPELKIFLELPSATGGDPRLVPVERTVVDTKTGKTPGAIKWLFTGSSMTKPDPEKPDEVYAADISGTLITIFPVTDRCVIQSALSIKDEPLLKMETDKRLLPAEGTAVKLIIEVVK